MKTQEIRELCDQANLDDKDFVKGLKDNISGDV